MLDKSDEEHGQNNYRTTKQMNGHTCRLCTPKYNPIFDLIVLVINSDILHLLPFWIMFFVWKMITHWNEKTRPIFKKWGIQTLHYSLINRRELHIFSIKPKLDMRLFVDFCVFPRFPWIYLSWTWNCSEQQKRTILGSAQVNSGKNGGKHRNQQTISCQVLA